MAHARNFSWDIHGEGLRRICRNAIKWAKVTAQICGFETLFVSPYLNLPPPVGFTALFIVAGLPLAFFAIVGSRPFVNAVRHFRVFLGVCRRVRRMEASPTVMKSIDQSKPHTFWHKVVSCLRKAELRFLYRLPGFTGHVRRCHVCGSKSDKVDFQTRYTPLDHCGECGHVWSRKTPKECILNLMCRLGDCLA